MHCEDFQRQLPDQLDALFSGHLDPKLNVHLASCTLCRTEAEGLIELWEKLDSLSPQQADSSSVRSRFDSMLEAYQEGLASGLQAHASGTRGEIRNGWQPLRLLPIAAVLLLFVGVAVVAFYRWQSTVRSDTQHPELVQLQKEVSSLREVLVLSLLQQQSATERLRGVSWSSQIVQPDAKVAAALLDRLMHDSNVNVRLASVDALKQFGEQQAVRRGAIEALNAQASPLVQVALIDFVVEMRDKASIQTLQRLAANTDINDTVRRRAELGIMDLQ